MYKNFMNIILIIILLCITGCSLKPISITQKTNYTKYKYVYINKTNSIISTSSYTSQNYGNAYSSTYTQQTNPDDIIAGFFMKKNFIIVNQINKPDETIIINYGQSGRRNILGGIAYTLEITLQLIDAKTHELILQCTAEGMGSTEADDIRIAINRCLESL